MAVRLVGKYYMDFWSNWNILDRDDPTDRKQSWKVPNYTTVDLHIMYQIPTVVKGLRMRVFAHVFNLLNIPIFRTQRIIVLIMHSIKIMMLMMQKSSLELDVVLTLVLKSDYNLIVI